MSPNPSAGEIASHSPPPSYSTCAFHQMLEAIEIRALSVLPSSVRLLSSMPTAGRVVSLLYMSVSEHAPAMSSAASIELNITVFFMVLSVF